MNAAAAETFEALLDSAKADPDILAFWLDGSRGKGRPGPFSDYDCSLIVVDDRLGHYRERFAGLPPGIDLTILTLAQFVDLAAWDSDQRWMRYNFAHLAPLVDKTGEIARLMAEKARAPDLEVVAFIDGSLDHFTNQIHRALKCLRDGDPVAARLEGAEAVAPLLDAVFALNGGRLRPYFKYLSWELGGHPLPDCPWSPDQLVAALLSLLDGEPAVYRELFAMAEPWFRKRGHGGVFDAWGPALAWMLAPDPQTA